MKLFYFGGSKKLYNAPNKDTKSNDDTRRN